MDKLIDLSRVQCRNDVNDKNRLLEVVSSLFGTALPEENTDRIYDYLQEREALGSTALGHGFALPHARIHGLEKMLGAFIQLTSPIEYNAPDDEPVDLVCALLVPESATDSHLQLLTALAAQFNDPDFRDALRRCDTPEQLLELLDGIPAFN